MMGCAYLLRKRRGLKEKLYCKFGCVCLDASTYPTARFACNEKLTYISSGNILEAQNYPCDLELFIILDFGKNIGWSKF